MPPDIHKEKYFKCSKCHKADEMHGDGKNYANRYEVENGPKCLNCHANIYDSKSINVKQHHSVKYKHCYGCHVGKDKQGIKYFKTSRSTIDFKVGLNPLPIAKRPEKFVVVRHIPVDHGTFDFYVESGLPNFDKLPTWKPATPHNIRRKTPQNTTCNSCHGNTDLFLLEKDVEPAYKNANKNVIVAPEMIPKKIDK